MKKYLLFLSIFLFPFNVFAISNYNTQYNIDVPNYDNEFNNYTCGTENVKDFLYNFIDYYNNNTNYANLIIFPTNTQIIFFAYYKNNTNVNRFSLFMNNIGKYNLKYMYNNTGNSSNSWTYFLNYKTCSSNISTSDSYLKFIDYLFNNNVPSNLNTRWTDEQGVFRYFYNNQADIVSGLTTSYTSIDNDTSYDLDSTIFTDVDNYFTFPYWSSRNLNFKAFSDSEVSNSSTRFKSLHINQNNTTYNYLDDIPTYWDLKNNYVDNSQYFDYFNPLDNVIYNNFLPSELNNFEITLSMTSPLNNVYEYYNNLNKNFSCYGRVNHSNNYYTYEKIGCSPAFDLTSSINSNDFTITINDLLFYDSNDNLITNFSNYDKLFILISFGVKDRNLPYKSSNLIINNSIGNLLYDSYMGQIYDNFTNLPPLFKFYLSSNSTMFYDVYGRAFGLSNIVNSYVYWSQYNSTTLNPTSIQGNLTNLFSKMSVSNSINSSIMVFQDHLDNLISNIDFVFNSDLVISYSSTNDNSFYYIDSNNVIQNSNINVDYDYNYFSNNYDISYYVNQVNGFINDLSNDSLQLGVLTQEFYDSSPVILQSFLFVIFILCNIYFVYLLMRK